MLQVWLSLEHDLFPPIAVLVRDVVLEQHPHFISRELTIVERNGVVAVIIDSGGRLLVLSFLTHPEVDRPWLDKQLLDGDGGG